VTHMTRSPVGEDAFAHSSCKSTAGLYFPRHRPDLSHFTTAQDGREAAVVDKLAPSFWAQFPIGPG
jgi:hypothetical protein